MAAVSADPEPPPEPDRRLAGAALAGWIASGTAGAVLLAVVALAVVPVLREVDGLPGWVVPVLVAAVVVACVLSAAVLPVLRHRTWRYAVREEEIDFVHGSLVRVRTVVPMARVQHVETARGFFEGALGIATLRVHTAGGAYAIPGLPAEVAAHLRTEIARRARVADEV